MAGLSAISLGLVPPAEWEPVPEAEPETDPDLESEPDLVQPDFELFPHIRLSIESLLPRFAAILLVSGLSGVGSRPWLGVLAAVVYLVAGEGLSHWIRGRIYGAGSRTRDLPGDHASSDQSMAIASGGSPLRLADTSDDEQDSADHHALPDESVDQQVTRSMIGEEGDLLHAVLRCRFAARQRHATIHIGFCPPFGDVPQISLRAVDGPAARVTLGEVLAWGARIEVQLLQNVPEPTNCVVELIAQASPVPAL